MSGENHFNTSCWTRSLGSTLHQQPIHIAHFQSSFFWSPLSSLVQCEDVLLNQSFPDLLQALRELDPWCRLQIGWLLEEKCCTLAKGLVSRGNDLVWRDCRPGCHYSRESVAWKSQDTASRITVAKISGVNFAEQTLMRRTRSNIWTSLSHTPPKWGAEGGLRLFSMDWLKSLFLMK